MNNHVYTEAVGLSRAETLAMARSFGDCNDGREFVPDDAELEAVAGPHRMVDRFGFGLATTKRARSLENNGLGVLTAMR